MENSDKQLIRQGKYLSALEDNFTPLAYYIMVFENGDCTEHIEQRFESFESAKEWIKLNKEESKSYLIGNINSDWL